jgi:hypothetical protein
MRLLRKLATLLVTLPLALTPLLLPAIASADTVSGLNVEVYTYDPSSTPDRKPYQLCEGAWTHADNIDSDFDALGSVAGCRPDWVLVHYTGFVTFPKSGTFAFMAPADDGFWLSLDGTPIITDDWVLKGRWGQTYSDIQIEGGHTYALDAWFYEYGGGASATLMYSPDNGNNWNVVPSEYYTTDGSAPVIVTPPSLSQPVGLNGTADGTNVDLVWGAVVEDTPIEHYAVMWTYAGADGWGISAADQSITIGGLPEDTDVTFWVRSDNDTLHVYSQYSDPIIVHTGFDPIVIPVPQPTEPPVVVPPVIPEPPVDPKPPVIPEPPVVPDPPIVVPPVIPDPPVVVPPVIIPDPPVVVPDPPVVPEPKPEPQPKPQGSAEIPAVIENLMQVDLQAVDPTELTPEQATQLVEAALVVFETATEGSPEYQQALDALYLAAEQDDIVVDPGIANIPGVGQAAVAIANVLNAIGNVGADISPKARKKAQTLVVTTLVVGQIAQTAALATASSGGSSNRTLRRKQ